MPSVSHDNRAGHLGEASREARGFLIPVLLGEGRPAADVSDEERVNVGVVGGVRRELRSIARFTRRRRPAIRWIGHQPSMVAPTLVAKVRCASDRMARDPTVDLWSVWALEDLNL